MGFDESTAVEECRRELDCLAAAMERCLPAEGGEGDMVLEHFLRAVERVAGELGRLVAPSEE